VWTKKSLFDPLMIPRATSLLLTHIEPSQFKTMLKEVTTEEEYLEALAVHDSIVGEWEERGYHKGLEEGIQKGRQEGRHEGRHEGRQEGLHEGIDRTRRETIQMGYANGVPLATLCLLTGYSEAQVLQIIEMNGQAGNIRN
jgi:predicted transposase YdaD